MSPSDALIGVKRLLLDTGPTIYLVENHPTLFAATRAIIDEALEQGIRLVVSSLTLAEALSKPNATAQELQDYLDFSLETDGIEFREILFDAEFATQVGLLRRQTNLKLPDCIQLACAEALDCDAILTNDRQFARGHCRAIQIEDIDH